MSRDNARTFREPQSVARLSRTFAQSLRASDIAEPLASLDDAQPCSAGLELLKSTGSEVLGIRQEGRIRGWALQADLKQGILRDGMRACDGSHIISSSTGFATVLQKFIGTDQLFVEWLGEVSAVICRRDLQKPPVRMWLFGAITVFDANMTDAIEHLYPEDSWETLIPPRRLEKAKQLQDERRRRRSECGLVDCLQVADKANILTSDVASVSAVGFRSKNEAARLMRAIEDLRNHLAHAQTLERRHLGTAAHLASIIDSILRADGVQKIVTAKAEQRSDVSAGTECSPNSF